MVANLLLGVLLLGQSSSVEANKLLSDVRHAYEHVHSVYYEMAVTHPFVQGDEVGVPICISFDRPSLRIDLKTSKRQFRAVSNGKEVAISDFTRPVYKAVLKDSNKLGFFPLHLESLGLLEPARYFSTDKGGYMEGSALTASKTADALELKQVKVDGESIVYTINPKTHLIENTVATKAGATKPYATYTVAKLNLKPRFEKGFFDFPTK